MSLILAFNAPKVEAVTLIIFPKGDFRKIIHLYIEREFSNISHVVFENVANVKLSYYFNRLVLNSNNLFDLWVLY